MPEYFDPPSASSVIIKKNGKFLLIQEKKESAHGLWNLPGGRLEVGQTFEDTAIREAKEEAGFDVKIIKKVSTLPRRNGQPGERRFFLAEVIGGELKFPEDEIMDAKWFSFEEIKAMSDKLQDDRLIEVLDSLSK